ncbi:hypothetical protein D3C81_2146620 [compost metagenome]
MIKARLQLTDIATLETVGPVRLQAHMFWNARALTHLVQLKPGAQFGGVTVTDLHRCKRQHLDARIARLQ